MKGPHTDPLRSLSSRRVLVLPGVLLALLVALPWILGLFERGLDVPAFTHLSEVVESGVTLLLGVWVLTLIRREQHVSRMHLEELERLSLTDPLTGLGNRRAFERDLERMLSRSKRLGERLALLYMDVDGLKRLNDRFGHATGDETLRTLGAVLRSSSRLGTDTAYRVGGDEFVMVISAERAGADAIAKRVVVNFAERSPRGSKVSMGLVEWDGKSNLADLLDQADSRMYRHKHPGVLVPWS